MTPDDLERLNAAVAALEARVDELEPLVRAAVSPHPPVWVAMAVTAAAVVLAYALGFYVGTRGLRAQRGGSA